ncbi:sugar ABC transporter substrate-binding protein [Paraburkholderia sp. J67]|uniref:sugar ABC transporter substrate-binding protein n=1 Tax=Paraburkholderia sp. J67 TaxID=2805435 RepID=UPI002ABE3E81|nr:sugar ABC transporter substrate-binding protein [Paraburkholderia sp. J67]
MKIRRFFFGIGLAASLASPLAAHAEKIGVTMVDYNDTFRSMLRTGIADAAKKAGATVQFEDGKQDVSTQLAQIQNMIAQRVDAIIVQAVDTDATPKITKMVTDAHIPLVYISLRPSDFDKLPPTASFVGSDERVGAALETKEVCRLLKGKGDVVVLMGDLMHEATRTRTKAVETVAGSKDCPGVKVVDKREGKWSRVNAMDITTNWLSSGIKFDAIIANNDEMALGAITALKSAKKLPNVVVAGIDATPDALSSMKAGDLKVTVFQNAAAQGADAVDTAMKLIKKQPVDRFVNVPFELVTPANMQQFMRKS